MALGRGASRAFTGIFNYRRPSANRRRQNGEIISALIRRPWYCALVLAPMYQMISLRYQCKPSNTSSNINKIALLKARAHRHRACINFNGYKLMLHCETLALR